MGMFDTVTFRYRMVKQNRNIRPKIWTVNVHSMKYHLAGVCSSGLMILTNWWIPGLTSASRCAPGSAITCTLLTGSWNGVRCVHRTRSGTPLNHLAA